MELKRVEERHSFHSNHFHTKCLSSLAFRFLICSLPLPLASISLFFGANEISRQHGFTPKQHKTGNLGAVIKISTGGDKVKDQAGHSWTHRKRLKTKHNVDFKKP